MQTLSAVVLTFNEAGRLRECLESLAWADQIVVVDSFSTDDTVRIAQEYTPDVYRSDLLGPKNPGGYGAQRNYALEQCTGDWVFYVDADERVTPSLRDGIERVLLSGKGDEHAAYEINRIEHFFGVRTDFSHGEVWLPRIVRRGRGQFDHRMVHEGLRFDGTLGRVHGELIHYSKDTVDQYVATMNKYTYLEAQELVKNGAPLRRTPFPRMLHAFFYRYVHMRSYKEGAFGLLMALMFAMYEYLIWAKHWEAAKAQDSALANRPAGPLGRGVAAGLGALWRGFSDVKGLIKR